MEAPSELRAYRVFAISMGASSLPAAQGRKLVAADGS
jgi:hypothetical protein